MQTWDVMRRNDDGSEYRMATHDSRISALAQVLVMESGVRHEQTYRVTGTGEPACRTNRDLYLHLLKLGRDLRDASWSLSAFLRSLWKVSVPLCDRSSLEPDDVVALYAAAASTAPPPYDPRWSTADLSLPGVAPEGHADWQRVIFSQLADLEDFAARPPGPAARYGADAPRPAGAGPRATPARWLNFDPAGYLECAVAGCLGGWDAADGGRIPAPGAATGSPVRPLGPLTWTDLARLAVCGQQYS